jgi:hypothetical protein
MKHAQRDTIKRLAEEAADLAQGRRPSPTEGSADIAAKARAAQAIWSQMVADYDQNASWLTDRDQVVTVLGLAYQAARDAGFHTTNPKNLAEWLIEEIQQNTESEITDGE